MDYASAAAMLGVAEEELRVALAEPGHGQKTFADAAATFGVSEEMLFEALKIPERMTEGVFPAVGRALPLWSLHRRRTSGTCSDSMVKIGDAAGRQGERPETYEPDRERSQRGLLAASLVCNADRDNHSRRSGRTRPEEFLATITISIL
ncbi:MAG: hypothetical protein WCY70_07935 [Methanoculleus sp.]